MLRIYHSNDTILRMNHSFDQVSNFSRASCHIGLIICSIPCNTASYRIILRIIRRHNFKLRLPACSIIQFTIELMQEARLVAPFPASSDAIRILFTHSWRPYRRYLAWVPAPVQVEITLCKSPLCGTSAVE